MYNLNKTFFVAVIAFYAVIFSPFSTYALVFTPSGPEASGYLNGGAALTVWTNDNKFVRVTAPDGNVCSMDFRLLNTDGFRLGTPGPFGGSNWSSYSSRCSPSLIDWSVDGVYTVGIYDEVTFDTLIESEEFCQGDCAGGEGGDASEIIQATSSVEQTQSNLWFAYWTFFATMIFIVWLFRSTRK